MRCYRSCVRTAAARSGLAYEQLALSLKSELREALRKGDKSLLGVVLNVALAWPDCCFRDERVVHPHKRHQLAFVPAQFGETEVSPKEQELVALCKSEKARGRRVLVYSVYTGTRDTTARLKAILDRHGFRTAVLKASVEAAKREDWLFEPGAWWCSSPTPNWSRPAWTCWNSPPSCS
jgi:hypothetical protein